MDKHCIYDGRYAYLFNASFFEDQPIQAYPYGTKALDVMVEAAEAGDTEIAKRVPFFTYRSKEEFHDWDRDPGSCSNLIADADYRSCIQELKAALKRCMVASGDPVAGKI